MKIICLKASSGKRSRRVLIFSVLALLLLPNTLMGASFDCQRSHTFIEKAICSSKSLSKMDDELAEAYKKALEIAFAPDALRAEQLDWLTKERNVCEDDACLERAYQHRLKSLATYDERQRADLSSKTCEFSGLKLPDSYTIFAAGSYSGRKVGFQIDQSGHQATQIDVIVNCPSKPVVLMLGAYEPTIWNIRRTAATHIAALLVSGYHRQAVAGLDPSVPVLNSSYYNRGACGYFYVKENHPGRLNPMSRRFFNRPVDLVHLAKDGLVVVGDPIPKGAKLIASPLTTPESFRDQASPLAGSAGIEEALRKGLLRKATEADVSSFAGKSLASPRPSGTHNAYVVLKAFTYPSGLWGENSATFFIPKGVPCPKGDPGHSEVYDFNKIKIEPTSKGTMALTRPQAPQAHAKRQTIIGEVKPSIPEDAYSVRYQKAHRFGKYYFEVTVDQGDIKQNLEAVIQIRVKGGRNFVARSYRIRPQNLVLHTGDNGSVTIVGGNLGEGIHLPKVVIGVAVDLDSRRFYCHRDGDWSGRPPGHENGTPLPAGDKFYAEVTSSVSMSPLLASKIVSLNFGEQPFAYPLPIGYVPFDADSPSNCKPSTTTKAFPAFSLVSPGTPIEGLPLSVWIQRYCQWMKSFPTGESPSDDTTGARCNAGQAGKVFFLAGTTGSNQEDGQITRTCLVPKGKFVFVPLMNALIEKVSPQGTATCDCLVRQARSVTEKVADLSVTINGQNITSLSSFQGESGCFEILDASMSATCPAAAAGYWLVLNPLSPGNHEIQYSGRINGTLFVKRLKYTLRVE